MSTLSGDARSPAGPRVDDAEHAELDEELRKLLEQLRLEPLPPHNRLVHLARMILNRQPALSGSSGRGWEFCHRSHGIFLCWGQFGDDRVPVWKAMHAAFLALCEYIFRTPTTRQAGEVAARIGDYLELRGHPLPTARAYWTEEELRRESPMIQRLIRFMARWEKPSLAAVHKAVWKKPHSEPSADAVSSAVYRANDFLLRHGVPWSIHVNGDHLKRE